MKMTSISDIKSKTWKVLTLPSGFNVKIRKLWLSDFIGQGEIPMPSSGDGEPAGKVDPKETFRKAARIIARGVVDPPFSDRDSDIALETTAHVRDLSMEDFEFLVSEILKWSGLAKEVTAEAESFRPDGVGQADRLSGSEIREAPNRDDEPNAG